MGNVRRGRKTFGSREPSKDFRFEIYFTDESGIWNKSLKFWGSHDSCRGLYPLWGGVIFFCSHSFLGASLGMPDGAGEKFKYSFFSSTTDDLDAGYLLRLVE